MTPTSGLSQPDSLPFGWASATLGGLALLNPRVFDTQPEDDDLLSFVPMAAVEVGTGRLDPGRTRPWKEIRKGYTPFQNGDVLFAKITPCMENGKVAVAAALAGGRGAGSTEFHVLRPASDVPSKFLLLFLSQESFRRAARASMKGTAGQLRVPESFLELAIIPVPPLSEQERIVEEVEKQFTRLDAAVEALKRARANLRRYRTSVLKAACEGRLVPTEAELARVEGRDYEPADVLLQRILEERRAKWEADELSKRRATRGVRKDGKRRIKYKDPNCPRLDYLPSLPEGWKWASVAQLGTIGEQPVLTGPFGTNLGREDFSSKGISVLTIGCLTNGGIIPQKGSFVSEEKAAELDRYRLRTGDLLFSRMASVGRAGLVGEKLNGALFNYHIMRLRLAVEVILPTFYLTFVRGAKTVEDYLSEVNHGATRPGINTEQLLNMPVALPPLDEQHRIVAEVERRMSVIDELEALVAANLKRAERLRQSVLKRAFEGKLVPQDPNDEPASILLERIRAARKATSERAASAEGGKRMKRKRA